MDLQHQEPLFKRCKDDRSLKIDFIVIDMLFQKEILYAARPPSEGFILQESNTATGATTAEIEKYFGTGSIGNERFRNLSFISDAVGIVQQIQQLSILNFHTI